MLKLYSPMRFFTGLRKSPPFLAALAARRPLQSGAFVLPRSASFASSGMKLITWSFSKRRPPATRALPPSFSRGIWIWFVKKLRAAPKTCPRRGWICAVTGSGSGRTAPLWAATTALLRPWRWQFWTMTACPIPPLEVLLTSNEEIGLLGAQAFDASVLQGRRMLNLDHSEEGSFIVDVPVETGHAARCRFIGSPMPQVRGALLSAGCWAGTPACLSIRAAETPRSFSGGCCRSCLCIWT